MIKFSFSKTVAIYIDGDNQNWIDYAPQILKVCEYIGLVNGRCYVYGDWNMPQLSKLCEKIDDLEIKRVQVDNGLKNATDNRILIDIGRSLENDEDWVEIYVIVSSDADFASLCQPLLDEGKEVICIGKKEQTATDLENLSTKIYYLEDLDQHLDELVSHYVIPLDVLRKFSNILGGTYHLSFGLHNEDWVSYIQLEEKMREEMSLFEGSGAYDFYFGKYDLAQLISYCSDDFKIEDGRIKGIDHNPASTRLFWLKQAYNKNRKSVAVEYVYIADKHIMIGESVNIGALKKTLREIDQNYENHFSGKRISTWLKQYPNYFKVDKSNVIMYIWGKQ